MSRMVQEALLVLKTQVAGGAALDGLQKKLSGIEGATKRARSAFSGVVNSASWQAAAVAAAGIGAGLASSINVAMGFEKAMSGVQAKLQATPSDMKALSDQAKELGRTTAFSATEVASAMDFLAMAGYRTNDIIAATPGLLNLAIAGGTDLARTADIVSNVLGGFQMQASETGRVTDVMARAVTSGNVNMEMMGDTMKYVAPVAQQFGFSLEGTASAAAVLGDAGVQASQAGTGMRAILLRLAAPPKKAAEALETLGVQTMDAAGNMRSFPDILLDMNQAMDRLNLGSGKRLKLMSDIAGVEASSTMGILLAAAASGKLADVTDHVTNSQGAAAEMAKTMGDNLSGAFTRLGSAVEGFQLALASDEGGVLQGLVDGLANAVTAVTELMVAFPQATQVVVVLGAAFAGLVAAAPFIAAFLSLVGSLGGALAGLGGIVTGFGATLAGWLGVVGPTLAGIGAAFKTLLAVVAGVLTGPVGWAALIAAAIAALVVFREPITEFVTWSQDKFRGWAQSLWDLYEPIREFWMGLWDSTRELAMGFFDWIGSAVSTYFVQPWQTVAGLVVQAMSGLWDQVKGPILAFFSWWGTTLFQLYVEPWVVGAGRIYETVRNLWPRLQQTAASFWGWITGQVQRFVVDPFLRARDTITAAWGGFSSAIAAGLTGVAQAFQTAVVRPIQDAWNGVQQWLASTANSMGQAVSAAFQSIASGIVGAFQSTVRGVVGLINQVIGLINQAIGALNRLRQAGGMSALQQVGTLSVPGFATGGYVQRPTLAYVGEGGEPEYVVPASKMGAASMAYLSGRRGTAVLAGGQAGPGGAAGSVNVTIRTGPVMQANGQQWVTVEDLQAAGEQIAAQIYAGLRAPAGRRALGVG